MRSFCQIVVFLSGCLLWAALLGGCASGKSVSGSRTDGVSGKRVPMRPARRPVTVVPEEPSVDWPYGMYHWPDPWVPLVVYNRSGLLFFNAKGEVYRTYAWRQDGQTASSFWVLDVQGDGLPEIVAAGEPTLFLRSNADVRSVQPRGCSVMVGVEKATGKRLLQCKNADNSEEALVRSLENYATKPHGGHAVDESFLFDFIGDGQVYEFAKLHEGGLSIASRTQGHIASITTKTPVESMMAVDLDGDGAEELVVLTGDEVLIMRGEEPHLLRWPTDTRRYARVVVTEATEVVGSLLARESVPALLAGIAPCFEDELGLLYDKPDAVVQVSLSENKESGGETQVEYTVVRGYLYDEQLACVGRVLNAYEMPLSVDRGQNQLRFRVRINWRDELAGEVAVGRAVDEVGEARHVAEFAESLKLQEKREKYALEQAQCMESVADEGGWGVIEDSEQIARLVEALGRWGNARGDGEEGGDGGENKVLVPPLELVRASMRCTPDFDGDGMGERLVMFEWSSTLDSSEMCNSDVELEEAPCYPHRLHVLFSPMADWKVLAVIADHFIGYMHDRYTLFGDDYQYLSDGRAAVRVTFTNRDARTGCFFGSSTLMTYEDGQFVRAPGTQRQLTPCFPDMDQTLVESPDDLRCPGVHQLENIEGYKRAGFAEIYDHERGVEFRCFRLSRTLSNHSEK